MYLLLAATLMVGAAQADTVRAQQDSVRTYLAPDVVVTATRSRIPISDSPSPVQVITASEFVRSNGTTVADLLRTAQGVFLRDYGSSGQLKTVSMRGLSAEHVLVLLNGMRINDLQNGLVDLSLLPIADLERVEIVRGGSSAFYGGDALGGVVNLITRAPADGIHGRASIGAGSFGSSRIGVELSNGTVNGGISGGYRRERGRDDFPFLVRRPAGTDTTMTRKNADFLRTIAFVSSTGSLSASTNVDCTVQMVTAQRGIPGPIDYPSTARQDDENVHAILNVRHDMTGGTVLSLNGGVRYSFQKYVDPDPFFPIASRYRNVQVTVNPEIQFVFASWYRLLAGAEYARGILDGNDFPALVRREQYAAFLSNEMIFEREAETFDRFAVVVAARYDAISDVNASAPLKDRVFFKAGLNGRVLKEYDVRVRASAGTNFRVPTFNDLYYVGFNNPTLKPERSSAVEAGLTATLISAVTHRIDVTLFAVDTRERILFDPVGLRPENIGRVESRGLEIHYDLTTRDGGLQLLADASFTEALKKNRSGPSDTEYGRQLPYVPAVTGSLGVTIAEGAFRFTAIQTHTSRRFTALAGGPSLPAFGRTDANAAWSTSVGDVHVRCRVEVSNLFDADYQLFLNYPLPGRSVQAGVEAEF